jgi:DNA (cytosine-5)-methyltransferase 1
MTVGSLFAGIGGFDLAAERAGLTVKWQVEIDPFCRRVLAKHWPQVRRYEDVRTVGAELEPVDVITGGFPCQDISVANTSASGGTGLDGDRSGLWREFARIVGELRPRYVLLENSPALAVRGLDRVLADLAGLGFDAVWTVIRAAQVGARHERERMFVCAYTTGDGLQGRAQERDPGSVIAVSALGQRPDWPVVSTSFGCRGSDGIPDRVDRTHALGNAIVPQVAEWIFRRIIEAERRGVEPPSQHEMTSQTSPEGA